MPKKTKTEPIPEDEALCLLVKGREIVKKRWLRGGWGSHNQEVCSLGAIGEAHCGQPRLLNNYVHPNNPTVVAAEELAKVIKVHEPCDGEDPLERVMTWNDTEKRRKEQVVAAFTRAIKRRTARLQKAAAASE